MRGRDGLTERFARSAFSPRRSTRNNGTGSPAVKSALRPTPEEG